MSAKSKIVGSALLIAMFFGVSLSAKPQAAKTVPEVSADHAAKMAKGMEVFKKHVKAILVENCLRCHGGKRVESEFDLSDREGLLKGGLTGPAVILGNAKESLLYKLITHSREPNMPDGGKKLAGEATGHIAHWIDLGAPYDNALVASKIKAPSWTQKVLPAQAKAFWSFQGLKRVVPPQVKHASWCRTPVDHFILERLESAGLKPNEPASRQQLIRRVYFDLVGLPPPPEDVQAFLRDSSPNAYDKLIDRLLSSPHYGERWARHWLDLARFAESHGFEHDYDRPSAFHYRDFVIEALNQDLPFDKFVQWQIAGDELEPENNLALKATGFLAAGVHSTQITKNEVEKHRYDEMDDKLATLGTAMLGLTIGCARCHDHKFDPIPQRDYYRMLATFTTTVRSEVALNVDRQGYKKAKAAFDVLHAPFIAKREQYEKEQLPGQFAKWEKSIGRFFYQPKAERTADEAAAFLLWYKTIDPGWRALYEAERDHLATAPKPTLVKALIASEGLAAVRLHTQGEDFFPETFFLRRGEIDQKEGVAEPSFLQVLMPSSDGYKRWQQSPPAGSKLSFRRTALAKWLTDTEDGAGRLLARVIVNRLWQHHLGRGLVATPSDFGARGEPPTHSELLDFLASELIKNGWSLKAIHKLILSSAVYRQSSAFDEARAKLDRDNKLVWHYPARRLEAEVIRDSLLEVAGVLDKKMFGPGTLDESSRRRSIYFTVKRSKMMPMMTIFDAPDALGSLAQRPTTTIAPQALHLMNSPQVRAYAKSFAKRIVGDAKMPLEDTIRSAYLIALARQPHHEELKDSVTFVEQQMGTYPAAADRRELALADFCQVLLCLNEAVYVE